MSAATRSSRLDLLVADTTLRLVGIVMFFAPQTGLDIIERGQMRARALLAADVQPREDGTLAA